MAFKVLILASLVALATCLPAEVKSYSEQKVEKKYASSDPYVEDAYAEKKVEAYSEKKAYSSDKPAVVEKSSYSKETVKTDAPVVPAVPAVAVVPAPVFINPYAPYSPYYNPYAPYYNPFSFNPFHPASPFYNPAAAPAIYHAGPVPYAPAAAYKSYY